MRSDLTILDTIRDLFPAWFKDAKSWAAWYVFLAAMFALPMLPEELALYQRCTGRTTAPTEPAREAWLVVGRRGGKSFIVALVAVFLACFRDYSKYLTPGERGTVMIVATDRRQSRTIFRYIRALLEQVLLLSSLIERMDGESIDLSNRVSIEIHTASFRAVRGYTVVAFIGDEIAFWRSEDSANPDGEILDAVRPAMATIPGAVLLGISSPYARKGALYEAHRDHFGKDGDPVLVWQADTRTMNSTIPLRIIDDAYTRDPASAASEYGTPETGIQFRNDLESFINREVVLAAIETGRFERAPQSNITYAGFVDPSGMSSDSFTAAVAHREGETVILDAVREWHPRTSTPEQATGEATAFFKSYRVSTAIGDAYSGEWVREAFRKHGIDYKVSDKTRSELYLELLPALNSGRVRLLDNKRLVTQLCSLERRTARSGKDSVDHPSGAHDDLSNSAAGALVLAGTRPACTGLIDFYQAECARLGLTVPRQPKLEKPST